MTIAPYEGGNAGLGERIEFARALSGASLLPLQYRQNPANVLLAMELGNALGIAPIVAINEVNVINGSPSLSASLMAALARKAGHKVRVTGDDKSATCTIIRADDPGFEHTATWDEAKAKAAGLWNKGHWAKDPATMLRWRAMSECVRFACSEVLGGIRYTPEEVSDMTQHTVAQVEPKPIPTKPPLIKDAVAAAEMFDPPQQETQPPQPPREAPMRTEAQSRQIFALAKKLGFGDNRDLMLAWISDVVGHEVDSTKNLTKDEAHRVIESLQKAEEDGVNPASGEVLEAELLPVETAS